MCCFKEINILKNGQAEKKMDEWRANNRVY